MMLPYFVAILSIIIFVAFLRFKPKKAIYFRSLLVPILSTLFILCLIFFSGTAVMSAKKGIELWLYIVFPSLFPFFVGAELLYRTGFVKAAGILLEPIMRPLFNVPGCGSFALALGITSGYPVGAKITSSLRQENLISKREAERLLTFTNNSGPLFIIGAVAVGMFKKPQLGLLMLLCQTAACFSVGLLFRFYYKRESFPQRKNNDNLLRRFKKELLSPQKQSGSKFASIFGDAVKDSISTILIIGGFIVLFSVIINVLIEVGFLQFLTGLLSIIFVPLGISKEIITSLLSGFFEITTGTNMASKASSTPLIQQLTAASMIIGWAGLSVHSQVISIISKTDISFKPYLLGKFLQGLFSSFYLYFILKIAGTYLLKSKPAFLTFRTILKPHWYDYLFSSCKCILIIFFIMFLLTLISILYSKLNINKQVSN